MDKIKKTLFVDSDDDIIIERPIEEDVGKLIDWMRDNNLLKLEDYQDLVDDNYEGNISVGTSFEIPFGLIKDLLEGENNADNN